MEVRWSTLAAADLERIFRRIFRNIEKDNPTAAGETVKAIYDSCGALKDFPHCGRPGRMNGRRELVFSPSSLFTKSKSTLLKSLASITARRTGLNTREMAHSQLFRSSLKDKPAVYFPVKVAHPRQL